MVTEVHSNPRFAIEIGSAYGQFICQLASENPDTLCIGIEIDGERCREAVGLFTARDLNNVIIQYAEAHLFLQNHIKTKTIDEIHIYFPTPYPNSLNQNPEIARKVRGRIFTRAFVSELERVMAVGGIVRIVTDHARYFEAIVSYMEQSAFISVPWTPPIRVDSRLHLVGTRWERKQITQGKRIYFLQFIR